MKKTIILLILVFIFANFLPSSAGFTVSAEEKTTTEIEKSIEDAVTSELDALNLEELEEYYDSLEMNTSNTFSEFLSGVINGEITFSITDFLSLLGSKIKKIISEELKILLTIIILAFLSALVVNFSSGSATIKNVINIVFVCLTSGTLIYTSINAISIVVKTIESIKNFSEIIFPILLVLMTASGGKSSSVMYQPLLSIISTSIISIFSGVVITLITTILVLIILNNLVKDVKLNKLIDFCSSLIKWIIGITFTIFIGYATVIGVMASGKDSLSIKTAKYAINNLVPIVGGYLSSSFEIFRAGSVLLKNSLGVVGLVIVISVTLIPAISLVLHNLLLKFSSGLIEITGENSIGNLLSDLSKVFNFLLASLVTVFLMVFVMILLVVMTANLV